MVSFYRKDENFKGRNPKNGSFLFYEASVWFKIQSETNDSKYLFWVVYIIDDGLYFVALGVKEVKISQNIKLTALLQE